MQWGLWGEDGWSLPRCPLAASQGTSPCPALRIQPGAAIGAVNPSRGRSRCCSALIWGFISKSFKWLFPPDPPLISGWVKRQIASPMWTVRAGETHLFPLTGLSADQGAAEDVSTAVISPGDGSCCSTAPGSLTGMADGPVLGTAASCISRSCFN